MSLDKNTSKIYVYQGYNDTSDLESGTKTIIETDYPSIPQYTYSNILDFSSTDLKVILRRLAMRFKCTIDSMTATTLFYKILKNDSIIAQGFFNSIGVKNVSSVITPEEYGSAPFHFGSYKLDFYFYVDSGNAVLSLVRLEFVNGNVGTNLREVLRVYHKGLISCGARCVRAGEGTGTATACFVADDGGDSPDGAKQSETPTANLFQKIMISKNFVSLYIRGSVVSELYDYWAVYFLTLS